MLVSFFFFVCGKKFFWKYSFKKSMNFRENQETLQFKRDLMIMVMILLHIDFLLVG